MIEPVGVLPWGVASWPIHCVRKEDNMALSFAMLLVGFVVLVRYATELALTITRQRRPARRQYAYLALGAVIMIIGIWTLPPPPQMMLR
jgi:uncharacterized membrane protein